MSAPESIDKDSQVSPVISETLLKLLVCPLDKASLELVDSTLVCTKCHRAFPIENGIPNMLVEPDQ